MKKYLIASLLLAASLSAQALNWGSIPVYTSISSAVAAAKAQQKMLFVMTGTSWCPHCSDLKNYLASISGTVNADYVVYYCDGDNDKTMYTTNGYPTWGIFDPYQFTVSARWNSAGKIYKGVGFSYGTTVDNALAAALRHWNSIGRGSSSQSASQDGTSADTTVVTGDTALSFYLDMEDFPAELKGYAVLDELLPTKERPEAVILTAKQKMKVVEDAAKVSYSSIRKAVSVSDPDGNLSSLKLSYNRRQQSFKGTFKIYAVNAKGKLKKYSARVLEGILKDGVGTAVVTISGFKGQTWKAHLVAEGK